MPDHRGPVVAPRRADEASEDHVGDVQVVSNIDATRALRVFELWLDWAPGAEDGFSVRAGLYDLNSEFDESDTAGLFVNSSHGINPTFSLTGQNGPSIFPVSSLALRLKGPVGPVEGGYWQAAVLDGVPGDPDDPASNRIDLSRDDGALLVVEAGLSRDAWRKLAIGAWYYTAEFDTLEETDASGDPVRDRGNGGFYAIADRVLVEGDGPRLAGFLRAGYGAQRFNQVGYYVGAGLVAESFLAQRPEDQLGLALASAINGNDYVHAERLAGNDPGRHETVLELTWRAPLADWLTVQPGLQYVIHPGTDESLDNALVLGLRFEVGWSRTF